MSEGMTKAANDLAAENRRLEEKCAGLVAALERVNKLTMDDHYHNDDDAGERCGPMCLHHQIESTVHAALASASPILDKVKDEARAVPMVMYCPAGHQHIDDGEWAMKPHETHQCQFDLSDAHDPFRICGLEWRTADFPTVGIKTLRVMLGMVILALSGCAQRVVKCECVCPAQPQYFDPGITPKPGYNPDPGFILSPQYIPL